MSQASQIAEGYWNLVNRSKAEVETMAAQRIAVCKSCAHYSITSQCKLCGCFMPAKTRSVHAKCPVEKW